jgi:methenyltetrahydromethanopterin cyclohydrolase
MHLNDRSLPLVESLISLAAERKVAVSTIPGGGRVVDCGVKTPGGLLAGLDLARICMAGLAEITLAPGEVAGMPLPVVQVATDQPVAACLASQYAGWQIAEGKFFAMGSGPMRAAANREPIFEKIGQAEKAGQVVGVLEGRKLPGEEVFAKVAGACGIEPSAVTFLIAPTASLAGGLQVVARSVETAMHKLAELGFDLGRVVSAFGTAPLPPVAKGDMEAIGRTNDAILYGARVVLMVTGGDESLAEIGPKVPSSSSKDHGEPFAKLFARYNHDFYAVDPHLFSPAEVVFQNVETGRSHAFGRLEPAVLGASFLGTA